MMTTTQQRVETVPEVRDRRSGLASAEFVAFIEDDGYRSRASGLPTTVTLREARSGGRPE